MSPPMPDVREQILVRLLEVAATVPEAKTVARNRMDLSETARPAIIILDADEQTEDEEDRGRPFHSPVRVAMTPELFIMVSNLAANLGAEMNKFRRRLIRRVLTDEELKSLVGTNGAIQYLGCTTAMSAARSLEGSMAVSFALRYVLKPGDMED